MSYRDAEWLRTEYVERKRDGADIAAECGCSETTIYRWLRRHDIPVRPRGNSRLRANYIPMRTCSRGYETWDGGKEKYRVHRLLAVALYGADAVAGNEVHHINGVKWDNRPENIAVLPKSEHARLHYPERDVDENGDFL